MATRGGDGKRQKTSHSGGVVGAATSATEIDSNIRSDGSSPPETPASNNASLKSDTTKEMPDWMKNRIAELKEIAATPEFKEAMKPTSPSEPLYDSDAVDNSGMSRGLYNTEEKAS